MHDHKHYGAVPEHILQALDSYAIDGWEPGGFLVACLCNNLMQAVGQADDQNILVLREIVAYIHNELPFGIHGSRKVVDEWIKQKESDQCKPTT